MITEMVVYCKTIMLSCEPAQFCMLFYTQPQVDNIGNDWRGKIPHTHNKNQKKSIHFTNRDGVPTPLRPALMEDTSKIAHNDYVHGARKRGKTKETIDRHDKGGLQRTAYSTTCRRPNELRGTEECGAELVLTCCDAQKGQ